MSIEARRALGGVLGAREFGEERAPGSGSEPGRQPIETVAYRPRG